MLEAETQDRIKSALAAGAFHALLGYALVTGLGIDVTAAVDDRLKLFDVPDMAVPPPLPEAIPLKEKAKEPAPRPKPAPKDPEGAAAPPNIKSRPTEIVAPEPEIRLPVPSPVIAAPIAGPGAAATSGNAPFRGPGTGAGGVGTGTGSGRFGDGGGGGGGSGPVVPARCIRCELPNSVAPPHLAETGFTGAVHVRFTIQASGRVRPCTVTRSSGDRELDRVTCREIERRYRYRPARDAWGRPVAETLSGPHEWDMRVVADRWVEPTIPDDEGL